MRNSFLVLFVGVGVAVFAAQAPARADAGQSASTPVAWSSPPLAGSDFIALPEIGAVADPVPSMETPLKRLYCVEYARLRSGLAIFGDAKFWWGRAKNLYARLTEPVSEAVMVFKPDRRIRLGHVAVVTAIVSDREIRIDQANWQNHGEIEHDIPVKDVSRKNDWSQVRVWDIGSGSFGRVYPVSGFIAKGLVQQAANN